MSIHVAEIREGEEGIEKQIEMSALSMLFDNVQKHQYSEPEKSTIRELTSNAVDAVSEKLTALSIIAGEKSADEVYITRNEAMYADSNYLPEYYDPQWLDPDRNTVLITYKEAISGLGKDELTIEDYGVGIGHIINPQTGLSRLEGVLKLAYSTKRNTNIALGKFGIGAKAALSTGQDSYIMITRHNGKEFRFQVYDYKAVSLVPKFNLETEQENGSITMYGDKIAHYLPTTEKNGTIIRVEAGKFQRKFYENAVKSQLLYFKNIEFRIVRESGEVEEIDFMAKIQYESENLILADNTQFSKPHVLLNGVNYGYINWERLELNEKSGAIAYKIDPERVSVHPSREMLIWDQKTREALLEQDKIVAAEATELVAKEMVETDLIRWIRKGAQALGDSRDASTILGKLLSQVDRSNIDVVFGPDPSIKYKGDPRKFFAGMEPIFVSTESVKKKGAEGYVDRIKRDVCRTWGALNRPIYIQQEKTSNKKEKFLMQMHPEGFVKIKVRDLEAGWQEGSDMDEEDQKEWHKLKTDDSYRTKWEEKRDKFFNYLISSEEVNLYSDVTPPDSMKDPDDEDEKSDVIIDKLTPAQERELLGKTICMFPSKQYREDNKAFTWTKAEPVIKDLINDKADIIYGFAEDEELIHMIANMLTGGINEYEHNSSWNSKNEFYNSKFKLIRVSKSAAKHFKNHTYITDFILSINPQTKSIAMHSKLVNWHTGRKIDEVLRRMEFLNNFGSFNAEITKDYQELLKFKSENYRSVSGSSVFGCSPEMLGEMNNYADKVIALQVYIAEHPGNTEAIAAQAKYLFEIPDGEETFEEAIGVNLPIYQTLQRVLEYIKPLENIFNYIFPLTSGGNIPESLEIEIREIMNNKGVK